MKRPFSSCLEIFFTMSGLAVWMSPILSVTFPAPGHCVTCFNHRTRPVGCMVCQIFSAHLNKGERAYLKNIPRISYKSEVDMAEEFINNEHQLQKPQKVMINSIVSTAAIFQKGSSLFLESNKANYNYATMGHTSMRFYFISNYSIDEKNEDLKEINGKDEAEASGDGLIDLPTIIPTTSMETVSVEPSNDDDITMVNLTQAEMHKKTEEKNN
ncbi:hypothetical protein T07_14116 [Trichinella nelsoni]|uniref:Uncharacterized protein n=1 Tax=Trichinella nelsoni TaxID=6336 RepID=A0A0V0S5I7_9BILA|nr:hypothetical protein T07_14116 [Trichinella nelsoni]